MKLLCKTTIALLVLYGIVLQAEVTDADEQKPAAAAVQLQAGTWKDVQRIVSKSSGKIVVVDVWSTSCLPCMKEFPGLVSLHREFPDDVVCISFNVDYVGIRTKPAEYYRRRVTEFLEKQQAGFSNFLCTEESDAFFAAENLSSIPAVYVYGRDGKLARRFDDTLFEDGKEEAFTYAADVTPMVRKLVKP